MASDFFYFLSTLPGLSMPSQPGDSWNAPAWDDFISQCRKSLSEEDAEALSAIRLCPPADYINDPQGSAGAALPPVVRRWYGWQIAMRNALSRRRAQRLGMHTPPERPETEVFPNDVKRLDSLFEASTPLERAWAWLQLQWHEVDDLSAGLGFCLDAVAAYALRVRLAQSAMRYDRAAGAEAFKALTDALVTEAMEKRHTTEE